MKGRQLVSIKKLNKNRGLTYLESPIGFVKGISEELHQLSPKERQIRNQVYLKSISPLRSKQENNDPNDLALLKSFNPHSDSTSQSVVMNYAKPKRDKIFRYDPQSRFSVHFHAKEEIALARLNDELFPKELNDNIQYLPDYSPSVIATLLPIHPTHRSSSSQAAPDSWKISTLYKSKRPKKGINEDNLRHSSFSTYATGWEIMYSGKSTGSNFRRTKGHLAHFLPRV